MSTGIATKLRSMDWLHVDEAWLVRLSPPFMSEETGEVLDYVIATSAKYTAEVATFSCDMDGGRVKRVEVPELSELFVQDIARVFKGAGYTLVAA